MKEHSFYFVGTCATSGWSGELIDYVRRGDTERQVTYETFRRWAEREYVRWWNKENWPFTLRADSLISFHRSRLPSGRLVYFFVWSAFEHFHAWVERGGRVYDWQSMVMGHGGRWRGKGYPVATFYEIYEPRDVRRYDRDQAVIALARSGHYGPWNKEER